MSLSDRHLLSTVAQPAMNSSRTGAFFWYLARHRKFHCTFTPAHSISPPVDSKVETHEHVFKHCFLSPFLFDTVRRAFGLVPTPSGAVEPSRLLHEHLLLSLTTTQVAPQTLHPCPHS